MRTTSPLPVYRSTRDTRNAPLWNPSSRELLNVEDDEAGRLAGFRARFGTSFDANREVVAEATTSTKQSPTEPKQAEADIEEENEFGEDDMTLLDLISSYGQGRADQNPAQTKKGGKSK